MLTTQHFKVRGYCRKKTRYFRLNSIKVDLDLKNYRDDGGNIKRAKFFNNVIDDRMFNIPLDQVKFE